MALYLVRSIRITQSSRLQKYLQNRISRSKHLLAQEKNICTTSGIKGTVLAKVDENTFTESNVKIYNTASKKPFHSSTTLYRRGKESDYETLRILDPDGQFLCTAEMLILEKFCHNHHRYTFEEVKRAENDQSANAIEADGLRQFQLIDKHKVQSSTGAKDKKFKTIKFHKDTHPDEKLQKVFKILVDEGKVKVTFDQRNSNESKVKSALKEFATVSESTPGPKGVILIVQLNTVDSKLLLRLFQHIQKQEEAHIASFRSMMEEVKND